MLRSEVPDVPKLDCQPVFLIGAARSGTKFLRDTLAAADGVQTIPFDINFVWRQGNDFFAHDELTPQMASEEIVKDLRKRLPKMARAADGQILLEKTVSNTLRVPFLRKIFPEAKFVHLIRDGRSVVESVNRLWDQPTTLSYKLRKLRYYPITNLAYSFWYLKNAITGDQKTRVWGVRYEGIYDDLAQHQRLVVCARQWIKCIQAAQQDLADLNSNDLLTIRYEDLVSSDQEIQGLCDFLQLQNSMQVINRYKETVRCNTSEKWRGKWTAEQQEALQTEMGSTLAVLGYGDITT